MALRRLPCFHVFGLQHEPSISGATMERFDIAIKRAWAEIQCERVGGLVESMDTRVQRGYRGQGAVDSVLNLGRRSRDNYHVAAERINYKLSTIRNTSKLLL